GGLRTQPVGAGTSVGRGHLSTLGAAPLGSAVGPGETGHATPCDAVGNPTTTAATTWESVRTHQRLPTETGEALSGHSQNEQKAQKAQNGDIDLSLTDWCWSSDSSFFTLSPEPYGSASFMLVQTSTG